MKVSITWSAVTIALFFLLAPLPILAWIRLPQIFSDNMMLQQKKEVKIWGWASPEERLTIRGSWMKKEKKITTNCEGRWTCKLPAPIAGGPYEIVIQGGENRIILKNVLCGEVWLCAGQSNMEMGIRLDENAETDIPQANYPKIRLFDVGKVASDSVLVDVVGTWKICSPEAIVQGDWEGFSAVAYYFGRRIRLEQNVPVGLIDVSWSATRIEPWIPLEGYRQITELRSFIENVESTPKTGVWGEPVRPATIYHGMLAPIQTFPIRGALWYQGESNVAEGESYYRKMHALIDGWRILWKTGDFPFYFVQIAPYNGYAPDVLPEFWEIQQKCLAIPKTGIVPTGDIGNPLDIHPKNKHDVGERLARLALARTYDKQIVASGPVFLGMKIEGKTVRIEFDHAQSGLICCSAVLKNFRIAGENRVFLPAKARIDGNLVVVWNDDLPNPIAVRYAWSNDAIVELFNSDGLPAMPFRTDARK